MEGPNWDKKMGRCTPIGFSSNRESEFDLSALSKSHEMKTLRSSETVLGLIGYPGVLPNMAGMGSKRAILTIM